MAPKDQPQPFTPCANCLLNNAITTTNSHSPFDNPHLPDYSNHTYSASINKTPTAYDTISYSFFAKLALLDSDDDPNARRARRKAALQAVSSAIYEAVAQAGKQVFGARAIEHCAQSLPQTAQSPPHPKASKHVVAEERKRWGKYLKKEGWTSCEFFFGCPQPIRNYKRERS